MGYRVRPSPYGYVNTKIDTPHGKRVILTPHPQEAPILIKMFELRAKKTMTDEQIVQEINKLGYRSRTHLLRDKRDKTVVIGQRGGIKLDVKRYVEYIRKPIYAGVNDEKWTNDEPVKTKFEGLVSVEIFNKANRGKVVLTEENGGIKIYKNKPEEWRLKKTVKNPDYPFKRYVLCPKCHNPLHGSASKGRNGKYYPAYHCHNKNHYFRVSVDVFEQTIKDFVKRVKVTEEGVDKLKERVLGKWEENLAIGQRDVKTVEEKINELENEKTLIGNQLFRLTSDTAIKIMEDKLDEITKEIKQLSKSKAEQEDQNINMEIILSVVGGYLENLEFLLLGSANPLKRATYFGVLFSELPTYDDLVLGNIKLAPYFTLIEEKEGATPATVSPRGFEPPTNTLRGYCSTIELQARVHKRIVTNFFQSVMREGKSYSCLVRIILKGESISFISVSNCLICAESTLRKYVVIAGLS